MATLHHQIHIAAPPARVWSVLADLEAVRHYNPTVASVRTTTGEHSGLGATRHCDLKPKGWVRERVTAWEPERVIGFEMAESTWPMKFIRWRTELRPEGAGTLVTQDLAYALKLGLVGRLLDALVMRRQIDRTLAEIFARLRRYIESSA